MSRRMYLIFSEKDKNAPISIADRSLGTKQKHLVAYDTVSRSVIEYTAATVSPTTYLTKYTDSELRAAVYPDNMVIFETRRGENDRWRDNLGRFSAAMQEEIRAAWQKRYEPEAMRPADNARAETNTTHLQV